MFDIIIKGGDVVDGSGSKRFRADVAVRDGKIARIGENIAGEAKETLDAGGLAVAPGFIDAHAHSDTSFLIDSSGASKLYQGITHSDALILLLIGKGLGDLFVRSISKFL